MIKTGENKIGIWYEIKYLLECLSHFGCDNKSITASLSKNNREESRGTEGYTPRELQKS